MPNIRIFGLPGNCAVLFVGVAALVGAAGCGYADSPSPTLDSIRSAWGSAFARVRPVAGRLAAVPHAPATSSRPHDEAEIARSRRVFATLVRPIDVRTHSAWDLYARGLAELGLGNFGTAADHLASAAARFPDDAEPWSDLAVCYIEIGDRQRRSHAYLLALDAADRALAISPRSASAAFNRALAFERLFLPSAAAWKTTMGCDPSAAWEAEANLHLAAADRQGAADSWPVQQARLERLALAGDTRGLASWVARVPQAARELAEEVELPAWGEAVLADRGTDAERALRIGRALGAALAAYRDEAMVADSVQAIDRASERRAGRAGRQTDAPRQDSAAQAVPNELAAAHAAYGRGITLYEHQQFDSAEAVFQRAADQFRVAGSPFAGWARFQLARCAFQHSDYDRVARLLAPLEGTGAGKLYPALRGRTCRVKGLVAAVTGRPIEALAAWEEARALFAPLAEHGSLVALDSGSAEVLASLGRKEESWRFLLRALSEASTVDPILDPGHALERAALAGEEEGAFAAALDFRNEQVHRARASGSPLRVAGALLHRAVTRSGGGNPALALSDIAEAKRVTAAVPDDSARTSEMGDILSAEGRIRRRIDAASAIPSLAAAEQIFARTHYRYPLAAAHLEMGLAELAIRRNDRAENELRAAAAEVEKERGAIPDSASRSSYLGQMREVYEATVEFEAGRRRPELGLAASELYRGRTLLDVLASDRAAALRLTVVHPLTPAEIAAATPEDTACVEFAFAHGRLFTWVVTRRGLRLLESNLGVRAERRIGVLAKRLRSELGTSSPPQSPATHGEGSAAVLLDEELLQPIEGELTPGTRLVLAPDGPLDSLPFAALHDRKGLYVIARHSLVLAPSLSYFVASRRVHRTAEIGARRGEDADRVPARVLAVGDPAFDTAAYGDLPRLPGAASEAAAVARLLPGSLALVGTEASVTRLLDLADKFPILHFAGHALINNDQPLLSQLLLASDPAGGPGVLYARNVLDQRFAHTRLVLLAACQTADPQSISGQGLAGLASVFLAAGVPSVIATLWNIEDNASSALLDRFYRHLATGANAADALRAAQLDLLGRPDSPLSRPAAWAAFEIIGDPPAFRPQPAAL